MLKRLQPLSFLIGFILLAALLWRLNLADTWAVLRNSAPLWLTLALLGILPEILFKGWRLKSLAKRLGSKLSFWDGIRIYLAGQPLAALTPAKLGDVVRVGALSRQGKLDLAPALAVHVADKVYDLAALSLWAAAGLLSLLFADRHRGAALAALVGILLGAVLVTLLTNREWVRRVAKPLVLALAPEKLAQNLHHHGRQFYDAFPALLAPSALSLAIAQSLGAWAASVARACFCAQALHLAIPTADLVLLLPAVIMVEFLPVSIMGFGTREAALFLIFTTPAVSREALLSFSLLTVAVGPVLTALLGVPAAGSLAARKAAA